MFGYIKPFTPELRVMDEELYRAYYCGVCRGLTNYGAVSRLTLNYDAAFAAVLLAGVSSLAPSFERRGCAVHPMRGKTPCVLSDEATDYAAGLCVLLAKYKLLDDAEDGRPMRKAYLPPLSRGVRRAEKKYPEAAEALENGLKKLKAIEAEKTCDADSAPICFGETLGALLAAYPHSPSEAKPLLNELGKRLGGFIYAADAWDDRSEDEKRGGYNIFLRSGMADARATCEAMLDMYINSAVLAYDLMDITVNKPLLDNIMYMGLAARAAEVLKGKEGEE